MGLVFYCVQASGTRRSALFLNPRLPLLGMRGSADFLAINIVGFHMLSLPFTTLISINVWSVEWIASIVYTSIIPLFKDKRLLLLMHYSSFRTVVDAVLR